jgi:hypothetical protein
VESTDGTALAALGKSKSGVRDRLTTQHSTRKRGLISTVFNLFNDVLGAGVVAMVRCALSSPLFALLILLLALVSSALLFLSVR